MSDARIIPLRRNHEAAIDDDHGRLSERIRATGRGWIDAIRTRHPELWPERHVRWSGLAYPCPEPDHTWCGCGCGHKPYEERRNHHCTAHEDSA